MSLSFIQEMQIIANDESLQEKTREEDFKQRQNKVKHELFVKLTNKYYWLIIESIKYASMNGRNTNTLIFAEKISKLIFQD